MLFAEISRNRNEPVNAPEEIQVTWPSMMKTIGFK